MFDLGIFYFFILAPLFFILRKRKAAALLWGWPFLAAGYILLFFYPLLFNSPANRLCENDSIVSGLEWEPFAKGQRLSYFEWRDALEARQKIELHSADRKFILEPKSVSIPWWLPETVGDELQESGGIAYRCGPVIGIEATPWKTRQYYSLQFLRIQSIAELPVSNKQEARSILANLPPEAIVKAVAFYNADRKTLLMQNSDGPVNPIHSYNLEANGTPILPFDADGYYVLRSVKKANTYSPLALFGADVGSEISIRVFASQPDKPLVTTTEKQWMALGFVQAPRIYRLSLTSAARAAAGSLWRMFSWGEGYYRLWNRHANRPWYLLPLAKFWKADFIYFKISSMLLALGLLTMLAQLLSRFSVRIRKINENWKIFTILVCALFLLLNDTWVIVLF